MNKSPDSSPTLIVIAGGSGTGKTSVQNLLVRDPNILKIITTTTRMPRAGEVNEKDYYFISKEKFQEEIEKNSFLEYVVYDGNHYGIHKKVIDLVLNKNKKNGVVIVDVAGMRKIRKHCQGEGIKTISYWFKAESLEKLVEHMRKRNTSDSEIVRRLIIEEQESNFIDEFDYVLTIRENELEAAVKKIKSLICP
jgi:guanylate kinase